MQRAIPVQLQGRMGVNRTALSGLDGRDYDHRSLVLAEIPVATTASGGSYSLALVALGLYRKLPLIV